MTRSALSLLLAVVHSWGSAVGRPNQAPLASASVIYVTVTDSRNGPVEGLGVGDFVVKEDGKEREVLSVEPATARLQIAVLVDDNGTGIFGYGLSRFAERLQGNADIAFRAVTNQVQAIADFSPDVNVWMSAIGRLGVRPATPEGGQLLEGIFEAAKDFTKREARRPVIIALTVGGDEQSPRLATQVLNELWKSHAALYVIFVDNPAVRPTRPVSKPSDLLENNVNLARVLGDGPKESGGRRREVLATGVVQTEVQQIAGELRRQYAIAYVRLNSNGSTKLQVSSRRPGVNVTAPARAPAR
jgi:hypothetical protein